MGISAGHALFAVMESLKYGIIYLFSRAHARELGYPLGEKGLLDATHIRLNVLAPASYYQHTPGQWLPLLCAELSVALTEEITCRKIKLLSMQVSCEQFPSWFAWPATDEDLIRALISRETCLHFAVVAKP
jgi:hypothetical protein